MSDVTLNKKIPDFTAAATNDTTVNMTSFQGSKVILYFYPRDNTPGCTQESEDFRDNFKQFVKEEAIIFGISRDSIKSHEKFKEKLNLPFELISDQDETLCDLFGVRKDKKMNGKKVRSTERSTFLIDKNGTLVQEWRKVKVPEHVNEVLAAVKALS